MALILPEGSLSNVKIPSLPVAVGLRHLVLNARSCYAGGMQLTMTQLVGISYYTVVALDIIGGEVTVYNW